MLKILLVSPTDPIKPGNLKYLVGGENTFTQTLLKKPPKNVVYLHHFDALKKGYIEYLPIHRFLSLLVKLRILPISSGTFCLKINRAFDLVHCHGYSLFLKGKALPVVISDSSSNYLFLKDYLNWPLWRINFGYFLRRNLFRFLGVVDPDTNLENAEKLIVFSDFAKKTHHLLLGAPKEKILVIRPGILDSGRRSKKLDNKTVNILFVGIWFERKGGRLVVEAFNRLCEKYSNIRLTIVGPIPKDLKFDKDKVDQISYVPHRQLLSKYFAKADIFVLVPLKAEGLGFVVLEAASFGIPSIVSDVYALPEIVEDGKTGFVVKKGRVASLQKSLELLIRKKSLRVKMGIAAREKFEKSFSADTMNKKLAKLYKSVL